MGELINGRTAEEIKHWMRCCSVITSCYSCPYNQNDYCVSESVLPNALAYIQHLEAQQPKWISVKERLPEKDGEYLVLKVHSYRKDDGYMAQGVALFLRTRDPEWVIGNLCEVTHYMPLPQPPEEE